VTDRRLPRLNGSLRELRNGNHEPRSWTERVLQSLGARTVFADSVLGDLAEERARRATAHGPVSARWWYACEALRSAPYLLWNAVGHGGWRGRARAATVLGAVALVPLVTALVFRLRDGPPVHLVMGTGDAADGLIVNSVRPLQLSMRVLDAAGHVLGSTGVSYRWESGAPASVTPTGVVTCAQPGDALLRASVGAVTSSLRLRCRPVSDVRAPAMLDLVVSDRLQDVPFVALDAQGRPVSLLAGRITVGDSSMVTVKGSRMRGRAAGSTSVTVRIGDRESFSSVHVYERVSSLARIRPGQHVAVSVHLPTGDISRWRIPAGSYSLGILPDRESGVRPGLAVVGANCKPVLGHLWCAAGHDATVIAYHPRNIDVSQVLDAVIVVWRQDDP
jgi:hypothetical protein